MKIVVTGSLGHIGLPLVKQLVPTGNNITVVSSNHDKQHEIETLGAKAAIGSIEDADFLASTFTGADAVYCMIPPAAFAEPDRVLHYQKIATNYAKAIEKSGVKRVIHLSSFGADLAKGTGIIVGAHDAEVIFDQLKGIQLTHVRPTYFYYNLLNFIGMIKHAGIMPANYGDDKFPLVAPVDIADAIAEELLKTNPAPYSVRYVASDERTGHEVAAILGEAINKPELRWKLISDQEMHDGMVIHGVPVVLATGLTEMYTSLRQGEMAGHFNQHRSAVWGKVKMEEYAKEFAAVYQKSS